MVRQTVSMAAALVAMLAAGGALAATITAAQAKREMVGAGYTKVAHLKQTPAGWTASALESGKPVTLLVDTQGDVKKTP